MQIRFVEPSEYDELGNLTADTYIEDGLLTYGAADPYVPQLRAAARRAAEADVLVAVEAGQLLGGVTYATAISPWADIAGPDEAEVRMLVVDHDARRRGVGRALLDACLDRAREQRYRRVVLSNADSQTAGRRLYEATGFIRVPTRDWIPPDSNETLRVFEYVV